MVRNVFKQKKALEDEVRILVLLGTEILAAWMPILYWFSLEVPTKLTNDFLISENLQYTTNLFHWSVGIIVTDLVARGRCSHSYRPKWHYFSRPLPVRMVARAKARHRRFSFAFPLILASLRGALRVLETTLSIWGEVLFDFGFFSLRGALRVLETRLSICKT